MELYIYIYIYIMIYGSVTIDKALNCVFYQGDVVIIIKNISCMTCRYILVILNYALPSYSLYKLDICGDFVPGVFSLSPARYVWYERAPVEPHWDCFIIQLLRSLPVSLCFVVNIFGLWNRTNLNDIKEYLSISLNCAHFYIYYKTNIICSNQYISYEGVLI